MLYLDHNATTPVAAEVLEAMLPWLQSNYGNPSSPHQAGREARNAIKRAREQLAELVDCQADEIIFTSGGTEANNLALKGTLLERDPGHFITSAVEHASVLQPAKSLLRNGWQQREIGVDSRGNLNTQSITDASSLALLTVMHSNNETGVIHPIKSLVDAVDETTLVHTDAVQSCGKVPLSFRELGVDLMSLSAHKLYGPKGVGALVAKKSLTLTPLLDGGGQESGLRGGTENVAAIVGFGVAAALAKRELEQRQPYLQQLRDRLAQALLQALPQSVIFAQGVERIPNTLFFALPGIEGETLLMAMDRQGVALSSGAACGSHHNEPSHVLAAMGVNAELARCSLRVSLGKDNSANDVDRFVTILKREVEQLGSFAALAW